MTTPRNPMIRDSLSDLVQGIDPTVDATSIVSAPTSIATSTTQQLAITATMRDGSSRVVTADCTYSSTDVTKATVSAAGLVTKVAAGSCTINVVYQGITLGVAATIS